MARLLLRRWQAGDVDAYAGICADAEVMRWIGESLTLSREEAATQIEQLEQGFGSDGLGFWAAELRGTGELIGFIGLAVPRFLPEVLPAVELGYRLGRRHWGQGLATEGARASIDDGFARLGLERVISIIHPQNAASIRVAQKLGMHHHRT